MNQIPSVPITNPYMVQQQTTYMPVPQQQPKLNAVNIEINNPTVGAPANNAQYAQTTMPYYTYPQAPVYNYPQAPVQPYYPPVAPVMQAPVATVQAPQPAQVEAPVAQAPAPAVVTEVPQAQTTTPVVPAPAVSAPETPKAETAPAEAPKAAETPKTEAKPEVVPAETVTPQVDLNSFIAKLSNPDFDVQASAMEEIANMVKESPEKATELVDTKVFDALTNIINFDSSKLDRKSVV